MTKLVKANPLLFEQYITEFDKNTLKTRIHYPKDFSDKIQQFSNISEFMFVCGKTNYDKNGSVQLFNLTNLEIKKIVNGEKFCILLAKDGKCYVYGYLKGELKYVTENLQSSFSEPTLIYRTVIDPIEDVFANTYVCFLTKKGELYFFTSEDQFHSGKLDPQQYNYEKIKSIGLGSENILILTENNNIYGYGSNYCGQLGFPFDNCSQFKKADTSYIKSKIIKVFCSSRTSIILTEDGKCYACGDPTHSVDGQLQIVKDNTHIFKLIPNLEDEFIENVIPGSLFVALKAKSGKYFVFGVNSYSQFGESDTIMILRN